MTPSAKPREFWIFFQPENENTIEINIIEESDDSLDSTHYAGPDWDCYCTSCSPRTHVIEYSAFEKLAAALRKLKSYEGRCFAECSDTEEIFEIVNTALKDFALDREGE